MTDTDRMLVKRAQAGDAAAFESLYGQHLKRVFNIAWRVMGNSADAEDVAQEVMLKAWRALPRFDQRSEFGTWLYRIAVNACSDELRKRKGKNVSVEAMREDGHEIEAEGFEEQSDLGSGILEALGALPDEYRIAIVLRDVEGYSYEEIASIIGRPIGTVRSRINRAREQMRKGLNSEGTYRPAAASNAVERGRQ